MALALEGGMEKKTFLQFLIFITSFSATAGFEGKKDLFIMEKSHNPENKMIIHTQTDQDCKFITSPKNTEKNYVEFYWSMKNGRSTKEVHSMIRNEIKERVRFEGINETRDAFQVSLNDLKELDHDLSDTTFEVISKKSKGECIVKSLLTLGPSADNKRIDLKKSFCDVSTNLLGVPNGCNFVRLEGFDTETGAPVKVKFNKR